MVGISGGKMMINSGKYLCGVCGKGVHAISVTRTLCKSGFTSGVGLYVVTCRV